MNASELEQVVVAYVREHLSPTEEERADISTRYLQLQDFLSGRTFQNGSYARFTSTTPVNDLDVIYVLPEEVVKSITVARAIDLAKLDIHRIIESLAGELKEHYGSSATIKLQPHSVGIYFGREDEFSIDVTPAVPADGGLFWVPEVAHLSIAKRRSLYRATASAPPGPNWIKSDPKGYIAQASALDEQSDGRFRKAAKAIKRWRWGCKSGDNRFRLKSFHIEQAATRLFLQRAEVSCCDAVGQVLSSIPDLVRSPQFPDRADPRRYIDAYVVDLSPEEREIILAAHHEALGRWGAVLNARDASTARAALGVFFCINGQRPLRTVVSGAPALRGLTNVHGREAGEQFLSDFGVPVALQGGVTINARVTQNGFRPFFLRGSRAPLTKRRSLEFFVESCSVTEPFDVRWKVKNTGPEAAAKGQLRGHIYEDEGRRSRTERTEYRGNHYVECYVIKGGVCVAAAHLEVPIGKSSTTRRAGGLMKGPRGALPVTKGAIAPRSETKGAEAPRG